MATFLPPTKETEDYYGTTKSGNLRIPSALGWSSARGNRSRRRWIADLQIIGWR